MSLILNHLRSHILQGSTKCVPHLTIVSLYTPAEVTDFDDIAFLDQDVFWLNIPMNETLLMHKIDT